ncbi:hypothetical protein D3C80_2109690 [compost metagenome]
MLRDPEVKARLEKQGNTAWPSASPEEFKDWAISDGARHKAITQRSGAGADNK